MEEFKLYTDTTGNNVLGFLEGYLHPVSMVTAWPSFFATFLVKPFVKKQRDIENIDNLRHITVDNTLVFAQSEYRNFIKEAMIEYGHLAKLIKRRRTIFLRLNLMKNSFNIESVSQYVPADGMQHLFDSLLRMIQILKDPNQTSFAIFQAINEIYDSEFLSECTKMNWLNYADEQIKRLENGADINTLLNEIKTRDFIRSPHNLETTVCSAKIIAFAIQKAVIAGVGNNANRNIPLFGTVLIKANCSNADGNILIIEKSRAIRANDQVVSYLINEMSKNGYELSLDLPPDQFAAKVLENLNDMKKKLDEKIKNMAKNATDLIDDDPDKVIESAGEIISTVSETDFDQEKKIISLKALVQWYQVTNSLFNHEETLGFQVGIQSPDFSRITINPVTVDKP